MRITFVAPTPPDVAAFGVRALSAFLRERGKEVRVVFLPGGVEKFKHGKGVRYQYDPAIMEQVVELCRGSGLIGISFMSNYLDRAQQLAAGIKGKLDIPLIVGGIHPTVKPDECLEFADIVCVGEGEESLFELIERMEQGLPYHDLPNLVLRHEGRVIHNPLRPLVDDLDFFPFYDFGPDEHYIFDNLSNRIVPIDKALLERAFPLEPHLEGTFSDGYKRTRSYKTLTTRGCPHRCTFCAEKVMADLYAGQRYFRKRSVDHVMRELEWVKRELPFVESIFLFDDTFLARPTAEIIEFSAKYKAAIGLPIHIQASPTTVSIEKMDALVDAGLEFIEMGIQSASERGKEVFNRKTSESRIFKAAELFKRYKGRIHPPCYHVILDNPWETPLDVVKTLEVVLQLPAPFWLKRASLVCFPGTALYTRAKEEGILRTPEDEWREIYAKHLHMPKGTYVNFLMYLAGFSRFPRGIIRFMAKPVFVNLFERDPLSGLYSWLQRGMEGLIILSKGVRSLMSGDFYRIYRYFRKVA